jgi:dipeptidase D
MSVRDLQPNALWNHFADLNAVPRPSKKEERVRQFMIDFGKSLNLKTVEDAIGNVYIYKAATDGMENRPTVILQRTWTWFIKRILIQLSTSTNKESK